MAYVSEPLQSTTLASLEQQIATLDQPADLISLATSIDELGRDLALEIVRLATQPELADPLKPVLLRVPGAYTRALLRAAEKLDDAGSPRRAARVLIEALRKAFDANLVEVVADALGFTLDAFAQQAAATRLRTLVRFADPAASRRELRTRHLAVVEELPELIDWTALDDELGFD
ncbi:MAG: hypothetical protein H0V17_34995 [Deltaproteobacteria bacterium]|nr:hypothetical protein [Deltaproteobacteria bacterium]